MVPWNPLDSPLEPPGPPGPPHRQPGTRLQRDQEFSIPGFPGRDFAKSRDPGIFRDGISLKFYQKKYRISRDFLLSSQIWSNSYILEDSFACVIVKSNLGLLRDMGFWNKWEVNVWWIDRFFLASLNQWLIVHVEYLLLKNQKFEKFFLTLLQQSKVSKQVVMIIERGWKP